MRELKQIMARGAHNFLDIVLPPRCVATGQRVDTQGMIAPDYWFSLTFLGDPQCEACGYPFEFNQHKGALCGGCASNPPVFGKARAALTYDDASRDLILSFKHGDQTHAVRAFLPWLGQAGKTLIDRADILVPIPLHWRRLWKRRYNQAALISSALAKEHGKLHRPDFLQRNRNTPSQGHMSTHERFKNVRKAFDINPRYMGHVEGAKILLIDDVYTTGATLNECARALMNAGAIEVNALTLARVVRPIGVSR